MTLALAFPSPQYLGFTGELSTLGNSHPSVNLREIKRNVAVAASRMVTNIVCGSCAAEPVASWQSALEPIAAALVNIQSVYDLYAEREGIVVLDDEDMPFPSYCQRALDALDHYDSLEDDWDDDGALAPQATSIHDARYFLRILCNQIVDAPTIRPMLDAEGIPGLFWSDERNYLSISFYGDFSLTFFFKNKTDSQVFSGTASLEDAEQIAKLLTYIEAI